MRRRSAGTCWNDLREKAASPASDQAVRGKHLVVDRADPIATTAVLGSEVPATVLYVAAGVSLLIN